MLKVLIIIGFALLVICVIAASFLLNMITQPNKLTIEDMRKQQMEAEHINFDEYDNKWNKKQFNLEGLHGKLCGQIIFNPSDTSKPHRVVIICHGHSVNHISSIKYASIFYDLGFNVIIYDHSYHGESEGDFTTLGFYERFDLSKVIDYSHETFGDDCILALHGESMGGATVLTELGIRSDIDFVIADCPFSNTYNYFSELFTEKTHLPSFPIIKMVQFIAKMKYGYDFSKINPIEDVKKSNVPICFIHGKSDSFINYHHSVDMFNVAKNPLSELHVIENAEHACSFMVDNDKYKKIVQNFVAKVLKKQ